MTLHHHNGVLHSMWGLSPGRKGFATKAGLLGLWVLFSVACSGEPPPAAVSETVTETENNEQTASTAERTSEQTLRQAPEQAAEQTSASSAVSGPQTDASAVTRAANAAVRANLPFADTQDFVDTQRGFIAPLPDNGVIRSANGQKVWDLGAYQFAKDQPAPATVNPSLWRQLQLLSVGGLFEVVPGIYQVRGTDLSNLTFVEGDTGVIIIDPLVSAETARASLDLYRSHRGDRPVVAVIYSHSHADHFGGVRGVLDEADVKAGKAMVVAPEGFIDETISENISAGNHMVRRAGYMFGNLLEKGPKGNVSAGLGLTTSSGTLTLIPPTHEVTESQSTLNIDGLTFEFLLAPGTEAPAEMHFYIPEYKALTAAENVNHTLHNLYTLRGAKPRDALSWSNAINRTIERWGGQAEVLYAPHHWPTWGQERVVEVLKLQRDLYKYLNDQTLRLANQGYNMTEAAEMLTLPKELSSYWGNRGYYGTVSHNVKAVWNFYLGWFDGHPSRLQPLPPQATGERVVEYMGGSDNILKRAQEDYDAGHYRWVVQVLDWLVSAQPDNQQARQLLANAMTQLGYQAEAATWRNFYLTAAKELRHGVQPAAAPSTLTPDLLRTLTTTQLLDFVAIRLNGPRAEGHHIAINLHISDTQEDYALVLENGVINTLSPVDQPDMTLTLPKQALLGLLFGKTTLEALQTKGVAEVQGDAGKFAELAGLLDQFDPWWDVVQPTHAADKK